MTLPLLQTDLPIELERKHRTLIATTVNELVKTRPPNDRTAAEITASVTPLDLRYEPGDVRRYGAIVGTSDSTAAFVSAFAAVGGEGVVKAVGTYRVNQVSIPSDRVLDLDAAVIEHTSGDSYAFLIDGVDNVEVRGGTIDGRLSAGSGSGTFEFGIFGRGSTNVRLRGTHIKDCYEDGIYIGQNDDNDPCIDWFLDVVVSGCGRNNISITHADGVYGKVIAHSTFSNAHYVGPGAGVDIEPDNNQYCDNISLDVETYDNYGNGVEIFWFAALANRKASIDIRHVSSGDGLRGLRIGRFLARLAGDEAVITYKGTIHAALNGSSTQGGFLIDDIGAGTYINLDATVYQNDDTLNLIALKRDTTTSAGITGVPVMRLNVRGVGQVDNLLSTDTFNSSDMTRNTELTIDVGALTFTGLNVDEQFAGRFWLVPIDRNHVERALTSDATIAAVDSLGGSRVITNTGAAGDITLTIDSSDFNNDQEIEFYVADAAGIIKIELDDTAKIIQPYGGYRIASTGVGARLRIKKDSSGDWEKIPTPRGDAGTWTLYGAAPYDPPSLVDGAREGTPPTVTVPGAALGNRVQATFSLNTQGVSFIPRVSAADTVTIEVQNETGGTIDLASGTLRVWAVK